MDREKKDELPRMQVNFINVICLPLYEASEPWKVIIKFTRQRTRKICYYRFWRQVLAEAFPWMQPLYDGTLENRNHWQDLAEKVEMGLTWIDHDVIEKPVEEFSGRLRWNKSYNAFESSLKRILALCSSVIPKKDIEFTVTTLNCQQPAAKKNEKVSAADVFELRSSENYDLKPAFCAESIELGLGHDVDAHAEFELQQRFDAGFRKTQVQKFLSR